MQLVGEVIVKVPHHVQKTQRDAMHHLPGGPPTPGSCSSSALPPQPRNSQLLQREDVLVPGVSGRQILHGVEMTTGAQHLGHMGAEVLQDSGEQRRKDDAAVLIISSLYLRGHQNKTEKLLILLLISSIFLCLIIV